MVSIVTPALRNAWPQITVRAAGRAAREVRM